MIQKNKLMNLSIMRLIIAIKCIENKVRKAVFYFHIYVILHKYESRNKSINLCTSVH